MEIVKTHNWKLLFQIWDRNHELPQIISRKQYPVEPRFVRWNTSCWHQVVQYTPKI